MHTPAGARAARLVLPPTALAAVALTAPPPAAGQSAADEPAIDGADRVSARAPRHAVVGAVVAVRGKLASRLTAKRVVVQVATRGGWRTVARARTGSGGRFEARWRVSEPGSFRLRIRPIDRRATGSLRRTLNVYRSGTASWYGPGLYGNRTACGYTLSPRLRGVAHKTLPCGTAVTFRYGTRTVTARVVDRGPFSSREWDLTASTKRALGFPSGGSVWSTR